MVAMVKSLLIAEPGIRGLDINVDAYKGPVVPRALSRPAASALTPSVWCAKAKGVQTVHNELKTR